MEKLSPDSDTWVNLENPDDLESHLISIAATVEELLNQFKSKVRQHAAELEANVEGYLMSIQEDQLLPKTQSLELDHDKRHKIFDEFIKNLLRKIKLVALEQVGVEDDYDTVYQLISNDFSKLGMEEIESEEPKEPMMMEEQVVLGKHLQEELDKRFKEFEVKMEEKYKQYEKYGDILERLRKQYEAEDIEKEKVAEDGEGRPKKRLASASLPELVKQTSPSFMLIGFDKPNLSTLGLVWPGLQTTAAQPPQVLGGSANIGQLQPPSPSTPTAQPQMLANIGQLQPLSPSAPAAQPQMLVNIGQLQPGSASAPSTMPTPVNEGVYSGSVIGQQGVQSQSLQLQQLRQRHGGSVIGQQGVQPQSLQLQQLLQRQQLQQQRQQLLQRQQQQLLASSLAQNSIPSTSSSSSSQQQP